MIEQLYVIILISIPFTFGMIVGEKHGTWTGIVAALLSIPLAVLVIVLIYRALEHLNRRRLRRIRETYLYIYRVLEVPGDPKKILKHTGAAVLVGDYGWEAEPLHKDGLIYLQGLTPDWHLVWYAGFRPNQIEQIARKPVSQCDRGSWLPNLPRCPYTVKERETPVWGYPW